jgi:hypothetical protein
MPGRERIGVVSAEDAEAMAVQILGWLISQPDLLNRFMALVGVDAGSIRRAAAEPGFLGAVTGFVMAHEPTLLAFCEQNDVRAERVAACHRRLAGPESESWS